MNAVNVLFWLPIFMQTVWHFTPMESALHMVPQAVAGLIMSPVVGLLIDQVRGTYLLIISAVFQVSACMPVLFLRADSSYWAFIVPTLVLSTVAMDWSTHVTAVSSQLQRSLTGSAEFGCSNMCSARFPLSNTPQARLRFRPWLV
jgi:nitrate/nitrite transporter NarK